MRVYIDFETRSAQELGGTRSVGSYAYAIHPTTGVLSLAVAVDGDEPTVFVGPGLPTQGLGPVRSFDNPEDTAWLNGVISEADAVVAHNYMFEYHIWRAQLEPIGVVPVKDTQWDCTMARAFAAGMPGKLEKLAIDSLLGIQKDTKGSVAMRYLSSPFKGVFRWDVDRFRTTLAYNIQDVKVLRMLDQWLPQLSPTEREVFRLDLAMNAAGVHVDLDYLDRAIEIRENTKEILLAEFRAITGGEPDSPTKREQLKAWIKKESGFALPDTQKQTIAALVRSGAVPPHVLRALQILQELSKTSLAKFDKLKLQSPDGIYRNMIQYHAAHTGRWGGRGAQIQNFPRGGSDATAIARVTKTATPEQFRFLYPDTFDALSSGLRGTLIASPGKQFLVADYSAIEARGVAWVSGETSKLDLFREGKDPYLAAASTIFGREINKGDKQERQIGKCSELAFGYGGGINAYRTMAKSYDLDLSSLPGTILPTATLEEMRRAEFCYKLHVRMAGVNALPLDLALAVDVVKQRWRGLHPAISDYWKKVEVAVLEAIRDGVVTTAGPVSFGVIRQGQWLACRLPSGRCMLYPRPAIAKVKNKMTDAETEDESALVDAIRYYSVGNSGKLEREFTYGGKLVENIVQGLCRDIMVDGMLRASKAGFDIKFTIHDEVVVEGESKAQLKEFEDLLRCPPTWAPDFPLMTEGWIGPRYKKG